MEIILKNLVFIVISSQLFFGCKTTADVSAVKDDSCDQSDAVCKGQVILDKLEMFYLSAQGSHP